MKKFLTILFLLVTVPTLSFAQEYSVPDITISKDKVRVDGKTYYAHVVTAKQTLFSISKAYGVDVTDIYEANENLDLEHQGLKIGQVILIPTQKQKVTFASDAPKAETTTVKKEEPVTTSETTEQEEEASSDSRALFPKFKDFKNKVLGIKDSTKTASTEYIKDIPDVINVALLMPFNTGNKADEKCLDFYAGALIAARDLGREGKKINIDALDITVSNPEGKKVIEAADIIIGPISPDGILNALNNCSEDKYIVSPLDPKAADLAASNRVIQAPTPSSRQYRELARWVKEDYHNGDNVIVITQSGATPPAGFSTLISELRELGVDYLEFSYTTGSGIQSRLIEQATQSGENRYIIASENESFVADAVRNVNLMTYKRYDVALYAVSKIRNFGTIDAEQIHNSDTHIAASYYVDYSDKTVQKFVKAYRALCEAEPNSFAFHGYDTMHYFVDICAKYGRMWPLKLTEYAENGLQTNFRFDENDPAGYVNAAVRRAESTPDFKTRLLK